MAFSIGIGLTNECNLRCPHCYRPDMVLEHLNLGDIQRICDSVPVKSMNLGVGENGLHPDYHAILGYLASRGIVTGITSKGLSTEALTDTELTRFRSHRCEGVLTCCGRWLESSGRCLARWQKPRLRHHPGPW
jgi:MoaA/NifB/PqqE/SkfB family radical SAM enzyme